MSAAFAEIREFATEPAAYTGAEQTAFAHVSILLAALAAKDEALREIADYTKPRHIPGGTHQIACGHVAAVVAIARAALAAPTTEEGT